MDLQDKNVRPQHGSRRPSHYAHAKAAMHTETTPGKTTPGCLEWALTAQLHELMKHFEASEQQMSETLKVRDPLATHDVTTFFVV